MPTLVFDTNLPEDKVPEDFYTAASNLIVEMTGKPIKYAAVHLHIEQLMSFGGTRDPCALVSFTCIGKLGVEENKSHTKKITAFVKKYLNVEADRMYVSFRDLPASECGWNNDTFSK
ncbi:unnamed protein product [Owenia fusiformis]|uniref:L-dopachrome isomerase n=1 Tax=Owenia fusiformis TaxID=6347 RepID=A0A8S4Q692_OWEFU|nr:unnamed protein product [Owenia fusiformis]